MAKIQQLSTLHQQGALSDAEFEAVADRFLAAAKAMRDDGWWSNDTRLTDKGIKRQILRETLGRKISR